jgi:periplasmic protein TonB
MSIQEKIRYGAAELKAAYNRNLGLAFAISIGFHALLIGLYIAGIKMAEAGEENGKKLGINKTKLINIAPPPEPPQNAPPPPPPPMIPPELMTGGGDGGGVAARAGNPIPVPDAVIAPDVQDFATTENISVADADGGTGGGFSGDGTEGLGVIETPAEVNVTQAEEEPAVDEFIDLAEQPATDLADLKKRVQYPEIAKKMGIEGKVSVRVLIDPKGKPTKYVIDYSDNKMLEDAAVKAVMSSDFTPGIQNGMPVKAWVSVPVEFKLE